MPAWLRTRRTWLILGAVLLMAGAGLWSLRPRLLRWYYVRGLSAAGLAERSDWVERVVSLDAEAVPDLLECLSNPTPQVCANAVACLSALAQHWGPDDARTLRLTEQLTARFDNLSLPGREGALEWQAALLVQAPQPGASLVQSALQLLHQVQQQPAGGLQLRGLALASALIERQPTGPILAASRQLILKSLKADEAELRTAAVHLSLHPAFRDEIELAQQVLPLLKDRDGGVRLAALLAVGPLKKLISEDDLLPLLHDGDPAVRRLCEAALRSRGLDDSHVLLGRLITDTRATQRLQVLEHLRDASDLDPGVWLRRLSQDASAAVRAGAIRAASEYPTANLRDCLQEMARSDPSPTVRQLAGYYLKVGTRDGGR